MRERLAKVFAVVVGGVIVLLAGGFAERRNAPDAAVAEVESGAPEAPVPPPAEPADPTVLERGRVIFDEAGCARCHRLDGSGNPRYPLDGVGARRSAESIRAFIVADGDARRALTASVVRAKERYRDLPSADLDALVAYLAASR
ncbi:MAG: cytochrome c [Gemmatimonadota bacterium]|nr:cytochrome c [Gemmatimonadota bacterium]